ncbi:hypothetical protein TK90_2842 (plasmid) [Thioalkalivibrio sp. K90mix]|nr:hypothetical protein TK90_2842 [Thioalkalivibrio sp. K90mix]
MCASNLLFVLFFIAGFMIEPVIRRNVIAGWRRLRRSPPPDPAES